jgi:hypothetical protein
MAKRLKHKSKRSRGKKPAHLVATQVRGEHVATAKLTDSQVAAERRRARDVRRRIGELPLGWTAQRAEWLDVSRNSYEKAIYGESYAHLPWALTRPTARSGWRAWSGPRACRHRRIRISQ